MAEGQKELDVKAGKKKEVEIPQCPVHSVVVYPDRAEVSCNLHKVPGEL